MKAKLTAGKSQRIPLLCPIPRAGGPFLPKPSSSSSSESTITRCIGRFARRSTGGGGRFGPGARCGGEGRNEVSPRRGENFFTASSFLAKRFAKLVRGNLFHARVAAQISAARSSRSACVASVWVLCIPVSPHSDWLRCCLGCFQMIAPACTVVPETEGSGRPWELTRHCDGHAGMTARARF